MNIPSGVGYYIVSDHPSYQGQKVKIFKGEDCKDFKDSFQFLNSSLEKLVESLSNDDFNQMENHFHDDFKLLCRKGIFPYEWFDSPEKFACSSLPSRENFYSSLNDRGVTNEEYEYALHIWNHFKCETFSDYHDLYLTTDILLLSDIFETFRSTSLHNFNLDPAHYISLPSYGWDCMLKTTGVKLSLLTDINKYLFFENGCRGGISSINH